MYPLIEIQTVPIEIQVKTKSAKLEYIRGSAEMEFSRSESGDVNVRSRSAKLSLDTFERNPGVQMPRITNPQPSQKTAQVRTQGASQMTQAAQLRQASYEATATSFAEMGELTVNARLEQPAAQNQQPTASQMGENLSNQAPDNTEWTDGDMQIRYQMDKVNFDWKIEKGKFKFTPGDIEIIIKQQPGVIIKYIGGPLYVPPSSDPNYEGEPVDLRV